MGLSWWLSGKESTCQCRTRQFDPWIRKIPLEEEMATTPVFLPKKSHGPRTLVHYSPWGHGELDMTKQLSTHLNKAAMHIHTEAFLSVHDFISVG